MISGFLTLGIPILTITAIALEESGDNDRVVVVREAIVCADERGRDRRPLPWDEWEWRWVQHDWQTPRDGETIMSPSGVSRSWQRVTAGEDGWFADRALAGGVCVATVDSPADQVWLLDVRGCSTVRVNDEPRIGDVYGNGMVGVPVMLRTGANEFVFLGGRGRLRAELRIPSQPLCMSLRDTTFPTVVRGEVEPLWGSLLVVNATADTVTGLVLRTHDGAGERLVTPVPDLLPLSVRKAAFRYQPESDLPPGDISFEIQLVPSSGEEVLDSATMTWATCDPLERHRRTFRSEIDGSVQYYAVTPPHGAPSGDPPGLCLTLHGAGVEADGQAAVYAPKADLCIVAPTNRRAFGFDWEDWGRLDALEVMALARVRFGCDPQRTYLTGHSMGGHGTWHIGSLFPDQFAAIGPSAGWVSFATYAGGYGPASDQPVDQLMARARLTSDTLARVSNLADLGVYVLHGDQDDNVPVGQARTMRAELGGFHPDFAYREQPGAGHWWGNACCDWPPLFAFFADRRRAPAEDIDAVSFATPSPGVSARSAWVTIGLQQQHGALSKIEIRRDRAGRQLRGTTENIRQLALDAAAADGSANGGSAYDIELDGTRVSAVLSPDGGPIWLERRDDGWEAIPAPARQCKGPHRYGPFKEAFRHRFLLVYGTHGSPAENAWMLAKARFDAETFWYRGNGSVDVVADTAFRADEDSDRNVVVYGNRDVNRVWESLLQECPIQVARDHLTFGDQESRHTPLMCLFIHPRRGSDTALVAAIGGTDLVAMRATTRLPVFVSGTAYPDALIASPDFLVSGTAAVRWAGYFGADWSVTSGEWTTGTAAP